MDHALLPSVGNASLPEKYEAAKLALSECVKLDVCKKWGDMAVAMASYARQAKDNEMEKMALRIRLRAERRLGQLYDRFEKASNQHDAAKKRAGFSENPAKTRTEAAREIGQTKEQMKRAVRIGRVPESEFEEQLASENPPTVMSLAEQGMMKGIPIYEQLGISKKAFQANMYFSGSLKTFAEETSEYEISDIVEGTKPDNKKEILRNIEIVIAYLEKLKGKL